MRMYIPSIYERVKLSKDWEFNLFAEYRNVDFIEHHRPDVHLDRHNLYHDLQAVLMTLPAGSVLRVDRIYIRRGKKDYDSITFTLEQMPNKELGPTENKKLFGRVKGFGSFWAKLADVNQMEFDQYVPEPKVAKSRKKKTV